ncbi:MAG TPA: HEAT repeat domain-containing protein, partial [Gemmatales bacterium]|nr:HEAT repeat domain-containing protein [Gemmatales bacterium]
MLRYLFVFIILFLLAIEFPAFTSHGEEEKPFDYKRDITLPDGFVIERIAGPPLVRHPLHICLDDQGHAYVTEMAGINRNGKQLEQELPNSILRLIDSDQDGIFDQATTFADKMTFPSGVLWYRGAVYATSFPWLWKLKDTNGDGIADERTPLVGKFGSIGNGADLHGPQLGPDGWLYFCDGRNGHDVQLGDGSRLEGHASGLYRCKPDGTRLERIFAGGMDNPVEVAFSAAGEPFVCTNLILNSPRHDGVLLGIDGAVYPHDLKAVQQVPWTGQYLPIMGDLGWVAVSSIAQQQTQAWGDKYLAKYLVAEFNTHRIQVLQFTRQGASFSMQAEPFLDCRQPDFHPTQLVFAPDGSLLVVDTGGWFRNGCPTSRIEKPSVQGGIYRIRLQNQAQKGYAISKDQSVTREKLKQQIASENTTERLQALWALGKGLAEKEDAETQQLLREGLLDNDVDCVITAMRFAGQYRDVDAYDKVLIQLEHAHQAVRREAAATLARLRNTEAIPHLMQALGHADDPFLEHACIHALIQLKHRAAILEGLKHSSSRVQRGCLIALEQISKDILQWDHVAQLMQVHDARLQQACLAVMRIHPGWVHDLADYLDREL